MAVCSDVAIDRDCKAGYQRYNLGKAELKKEIPANELTCRRFGPKMVASVPGVGAKVKRYARYLQH